MRSVLPIAAACLAAGCATDPFNSIDAAFADATIELENTAFFAQDAYQCGPAALATLLDSSDVRVTPEQLLPIVFIPGRGGSLQTEMLAAGRLFGRLPYEIEPGFAALLEELRAGRPVLVLQNLGISFAPAWHYAVVIGFSGERSEIVLRSGTTRRLTMSARTFVNTWRRSNYWGVVLLQPGIIPPTVDPDRYLHAAAAAESAGQFDLAMAAYSAAAERWPDIAMPRMGLGNIHYAKGDLQAAEFWYRRYLEIAAGDPLGSNNLATVLSEQGLCDEALRLVTNVLNAQQENSPFLSILTSTRVELANCHAINQ